MPFLVLLGAFVGVCSLAYAIGGVVGDVILLIAVLALVGYGMGSLVRAVRRPERSGVAASGG